MKLFMLIDETRGSLGDGSEVDILGDIMLPLCLDVFLHVLMSDG